MLLNNDKYNIVNLDALTYAGNLRNLSAISDNQNYVFIKGDITDHELVYSLFEKYAIDIVVNFAAESHVDRSILDPMVFLKTNVMGTQTLLNVANQFWKIDPLDKHNRQYREGTKFIQVSTDEVYGSLGELGKFTELTSLSPNSPYSASKASADLFVKAYHTTYGLPINITRCSNNYGTNQFPEKLIPLVIRNCQNNFEIPVYGDGLQIRDWLHVEDHCEAIKLVMTHGISGEVYNIGGNSEKTNIEIIKFILSKMGKSEKLIKYINDRPGHDKRYAIDNTKITKELMWCPKYQFEDGLLQTINWYCDNQEWIDDIVTGNYELYYKNMYL